MLRNVLSRLSPKRPQLSFTQALKEKDVLIVDVRSPEEVASGGSCPGSVNVPMDALQTSQQVFGLDRTRPVIFYCKKGIRAAGAASFLSQLGYINAFSATDGESVKTLLENKESRASK